MKLKWIVSRVLYYRESFKLGQHCVGLWASLGYWYREGCNPCSGSGSKFGFTSMYILLVWQPFFFFFNNEFTMFLHKKVFWTCMALKYILVMLSSTFFMLVHASMSWFYFHNWIVCYQFNDVGQWNHDKPVKTLALFFVVLFSLSLCFLFFFFSFFLH